MMIYFPRIIIVIIFVNCLFLVSCGKKNSTEPKSITGEWITINSRITDLHIQALTIDPKVSEILYAASYHGIFKSTNRGTSWHLANTGMSSNDVKVLLCNPNNSSQIFAGTWGDGIFISNDAASKWSSVNSGIIDLRIWAINIDPNKHGTISAISETKFLESTDSGNIWKETYSPAGTFRSLTKNFSSNIVYVGTAYHGIYKSSDNGATWEMISNGLPLAGEGYFYSVAAMQFISDPLSSILAVISGKGIYISKDGGQNWQLYNNNKLEISIRCVAVAETNSDIILIGTTQGVFITTDRAQNWKQINDGLTNLDVRAIAIDPKDSRIIYAGTMGGGVFKMILD